jgi:hypothetical protein
MEVKSYRHFEKAKFKFEFCRLMFGFELEVAAAYDGMDWKVSMWWDSEVVFCICGIFLGVGRLDFVAI